MAQPVAYSLKVVPAWLLVLMVQLYRAVPSRGCLVSIFVLLLMLMGCAPTSLPHAIGHCTRWYGDPPDAGATERQVSLWEEQFYSCMAELDWYYVEQEWKLITDKRERYDGSLR